MKSVKLPDLSLVEQNVPFAHFHKEIENNVGVCYVKFFINVPLGSTYTAPEVIDMPDMNTIAVSVSVTHPKHEHKGDFELVYFDKIKLPAVVEPNDPYITVSVHVVSSSHGLSPQADGELTVRYKDVKC